MITATFLELALLGTLLGSSDFRTRIVGSVLWCLYFYFSASFASLRALAKWLHDQNDPPGGTA